MSTEFWIQVVIYGISFGTLAGTVITRLTYIEKKLDKHNQLVDRMYKCEGRIDNLERNEE